MIARDHTTTKPRYRGLTLIELLAALVVLSLFVPLAGGWLVSATKTTAAISVHATSLPIAQRALRLIIDDLDAADAATIELSDGAISMLTLNPAPGEPAEWRSVSWSLAGSTELVRTSAAIGGNSETKNTIVLTGASGLTLAPLEETNPPAYMLELTTEHATVRTIWKALP